MSEIVTLSTEEVYEINAFRRRFHDLRKMGVPWMPVVGHNSYLTVRSSSFSHTHKQCVEVLCCQRGTCDYESCGKIYRLVPGSVFVSRADEPHRLATTPKGLATNYLLFEILKTSARGGFADELAYLERRLLAMPRLFAGGARVAANFARLFRLLDRPSEDPDEQRVRVRHAAVGLLLSVIDASEHAPMSDGVSGRVRNLVEEMRAHPERSYPIDALAASIGFSVSSLLIAFKRATGYTPHAYLVKCRIDRAKTLLKAQDRKIADIALSLGFPSSQHFAVQFKNTVGQTPREWVKTQGNAEVSL